MTIYLDITQLEKQRITTGIQRVVKEFITKQVLKNTNTVYKLLIFNKQIKSFQLLDNTELEPFINNLSIYQFKNKKTIKIENIKSKQKTIFFDLDSSWNAPYKRDKLYPVLKQNGFLIFNLIYDLIPIYTPQFVQDIVVKNYKNYIKTVYKYSDYTICISKATQKDFLKYKKELNFTKPIKTSVVNLGSDFKKLNTTTKDKNLLAMQNKKYILFVGTLEPRKNHKEVLEAFDLLSKTYQDLNLIFVGIKGWGLDSFFQQLEKHPLKDKRLFWLKNIDDDTLFHFYQNAFLVTYLSKYEGFGLPIIESLQHGNITISSDNTSMPEAGLDFADYIKNNDSVKLAKTIETYLTNNKLYNQRKKYIKENFQAFTWENFAHEVYTILNTYKKTKPSFISRLKKWIKNLLRLNNTNYRLQQLEQKVKVLQSENQTLKENKKLSSLLDNYYLKFENKFRGSRISILEKYKPYLNYIPTLNTQHPTLTALDIACGRAEWVQLLQEKNIEAYGVDLNNSMLKVGKSNGVKNLQKADAFDYLNSCKDSTFDLISAFHLIEHIPYEKLITLLQEIKRVSKPNATILLETPNPDNLLVASKNFYFDPTHLNPLPSDMMKFFLEYLGFVDVQVKFLHPMKEELHLTEDTQSAKLLNTLLYKEQDYLLVAKVRK